MDQYGPWRGGRPWFSPLCARWDTASLSKKGTERPIFGPSFHCGQTAGCIKMPHGMEVGLSPGDFVLDGNPAPYPKRGGAPPNFGPRLLWPNGCMDQDATWYGGRPRPTRHCARYGPSYPQKKGHTHAHPIFGHVYCGQMAGWMKTPLGTEVDLGSGHIVLDGVPAPAKGAQHPDLFGPCLLWPRWPISATAELLSALLAACVWFVL